jgi:hypothetical protein
LRFQYDMMSSEALINDLKATVATPKGRKSAEKEGPLSSAVDMSKFFQAERPKVVASGITDDYAIKLELLTRWNRQKDEKDEADQTKKRPLAAEKKKPLKKQKIETTMHDIMAQNVLLGKNASNTAKAICKNQDINYKEEESLDKALMKAFVKIYPNYWIDIRQLEDIRLDTVVKKEDETEGSEGPIVKKEVIVKKEKDSDDEDGAEDIDSDDSDDDDGSDDDGSDDDGSDDDEDSDEESDDDSDDNSDGNSDEDEDDDDEDD